MRELGPQRDTEYVKTRQASTCNTQDWQVEEQVGLQHLSAYGSGQAVGFRSVHNRLLGAAR